MLRWGTSIRAQVWIMVLACAVAVGCGVALNTHDQLERDRALVGEQLQQRGNALAELIGESVTPGGGDEQTLVALADQVSSTGLGTACNAALTTIQAGIALGHLDVVDATGRVVCSPEAGHLSGAAYAGTPAVVLRVNSRSAGSEAPVTDPLTFEPSLATVVPLTASPVTSLVYLVPTQLAFSPDETDDGFTALLVDSSNQTVLMRTPAREDVVGSRLERELRRALHAQGTVSVEDGDGVQRLFRQVRVANTRFTVLLGQDESTAYAGAREQLRRNLGIDAILLLVLVLLGLVLQRRVAQPARKLRQAIADAAQGAATPAPTSGPTELAALGVAFNDMVEARRYADERFRAIVQHTSDYVLVLDADGTVTFAGPAATEVLGLALGDDQGSVLRAVHPDDRGRMVTTLQEWLAEPHSVLTTTVRVHDVRGEERHLDVLAQDLLSDPAVTGIVLTCRDTTERSRFEAHLAHQARHDPLTGLPNRASVLERLAARQGDDLAVLFVDLDRFKLINDSHGHAVGDKVLVALAARLQLALRPDDLVSRFGGDEFVVVAPGVATAVLAQDLAERVRTALAEPLVVDGREMFVSGSVGIAVAAAGDTPDGLLRHADTAMYRAKTVGRNCSAVYDEAMRDEAMRLLRTESGLHRALERQQLRLEYQPILDLRTGAVVGAEALVRWQHPEHGLVCPDEFIPVAEETGLIVPIGEWVLRQACTWGATQESLRVNVNVSARQLSRPDFLELVQHVLLTTGFPAKRLCLELTETLLVQDADTASTTLSALHALGVRTAIDDFGTGWSSLDYLRRFPVDEIKLDRSYVGAVTADPDAATIVGSLVGMAHAMGLSVTAEGIETAEQAAFLQAVGCETGQGYLYSRPTTPEAVVAMLSGTIKA